MLHDSLRQTSIGNHIRASILSRNDANDESIQELFVLLGIHCLRGVSCQPSAIHFTMHDSSVRRFGRFCGKFEEKWLLHTPNGFLNFQFLFIQLSELGNLAIHLNLRNLRPPGTTIRRIPMPDWNPLTQLYRFVSCPNYTYEFGAWFSFSVMTQCVPAFLFAVAGLVQMAIWAKGKHRMYCKEFKDYPKNRKAILPFLV